MLAASAAAGARSVKLQRLLAIVAYIDIDTASADTIFFFAFRLYSISFPSSSSLQVENCINKPDWEDINTQLAKAN